VREDEVGRLPLPIEATSDNAVVGGDEQMEKMIRMVRGWQIMLVGLLGCCLTCTTPALSADSGMVVPPEIFVPRVEVPPILDGIAHADEWNGAARIEGLGKEDPAASADLRADVWLLYDWEALYVAFICHDVMANRVVRSVTEEDSRRIFGNATVEIFFDADNDREDYYHLTANALGTRYDAWVERVQQHWWDGEWSACSAVGEKAWTVELKLPFSTFGVEPSPGGRVGVNFARCTATEGESRGGADIWRGRFHVPRQFGSLRLGQPVGRRRKPIDGKDGIFNDMMKTIQAELSNHGRWHQLDLTPGAAEERARRLVANLPALDVIGTPYVVWTSRAITNEHLYPWTVPLPQQVHRPLRISACRNEFESATFSILSLRDLEEVVITVSDLTDEAGNRIGAGAIDATIVKCWYQGARKVTTREADALKAELLLHDNSIVEVDYANRDNKLNFEYIPRDAEKLLPVNIPAFENRQFWVTLKVPPGAPAGDYSGAIQISPRNAPSYELPFSARVHPFDLAEPRLEYSVYYPKRVKGETEEEQQVMWDFMLAELVDMVDHGITNPSTYVAASGENMRRLRAIREEAGCKNDGPIYLVTFGVGYATDEVYLEGVRKQVGETVRMLKGMGYSDVYCQGIDEAGSEILKRERPGWEACHEGGGKMFVAIGSDGVEVVIDLLDTAVISGWVDPGLIRRIHEHGNRAFSYAHPFMGYEVPETYRRYAGISLWVRGFDGSMNWSYQGMPNYPGKSEKGYNWDDLNLNTKFRRKGVMAYPAWGKPISTRQWEGWREGVDDVRYLSTLMGLIEEAEGGSTAGIAARAREWLDSLDETDDLDEVREQAVEWIMGLWVHGQEERE
jgi:hypothetical protein